MSIFLQKGEMFQACSMPAVAPVCQPHGTELVETSWEELSWEQAGFPWLSRSPSFSALGVTHMTRASSTLTWIRALRHSNGDIFIGIGILIFL